MIQNPHANWDGTLLHTSPESPTDPREILDNHLVLLRHWRFLKFAARCTETWLTNPQVAKQYGLSEDRLEQLQRAAEQASWGYIGSFPLTSCTERGCIEGLVNS